MSGSNSKLPAIILVIAAIFVLGGFYYADRSSQDVDMAAITETANTHGMIDARDKYNRHRTVFSHRSFSGSMDDYLAKIDADKAAGKDSKIHSGYSGKDYAQKHRQKESSHQIANSSQHQGFSGSVDSYLKKYN